MGFSLGIIIWEHAPLIILQVIIRAMRFIMIIYIKIWQLISSKCNLGGVYLSFRLLRDLLMVRLKNDLYLESINNYKYIILININNLSGFF